jgi:hypothetical protein
MTESLTEGAAGALAKSVAGRVSRRSFIGRLAKYCLVAIGSSTVADMIFSQAYALNCDCAGAPQGTGCSQFRSCSGCTASHSVTCKGLTGSGCPATGGTGGSCPSCTTACGSWVCTNCPSCGGGSRVWTDCCATCGQCTGASTCQPVCDVDGASRATCCTPHYYTGGPGGCPYIVCRYEQCA